MTKRQSAWVVCIFAFATSAGLVAAGDRASAGVAWSASLWSIDLKASATWSYNPVTGDVIGTLSDNAALDSRCATMSVQGYSASRGWSAWARAQVACVGTTANVSFAMNDYWNTVKVRVCTGDAQCRSTGPDRNCSAELPWRHQPQAETNAELQYVALIDVCSDHAQTMTTIRNRTDVVWSITRVNGTIPPVTFTGETATNVVFRQVRPPDAGLRPLMSAGATAHIAAPPTTLRWLIEPALSVTLLPIDTLVDELVSYLGSSRQLQSTSKGWEALRACSAAVFALAKNGYDMLESDDVADVVLKGVGVAGAGISCNSKLSEALRERGRTWPAAVGVDDLGRLFDSTSAWAGRFRTLKKTLGVVNQLF